MQPVIKISWLKTARSEDQGIFWETESPSNIRSYVHKFSSTSLFKPMLNKDSPNRQANWTGKNPWGLNPRKRPISNKGMPRTREIVSPKEEHTNCLSNIKWSALKIYDYLFWRLFKILWRLVKFYDLTIWNQPWFSIKANNQLTFTESTLLVENLQKSNCRHLL